MAPDSRKRSADGSEGQPQTKRQCVAPGGPVLIAQKLGQSPAASTQPTSDELAKTALRRSIALALQRVGFDSATPDAMESFVLMAETCRPPLAHSLCHWPWRPR